MASVIVVRVVTADLETAFDAVADFSRSAVWDPGVARARRLDDGPVQVGSRFALRYAIAGPLRVPLTYEVAVLERPHQVVLRSRSLAHEGEDDVRFSAAAAGTRIEWRASFRLRGPGVLWEPALRVGFPRVAAEAGDGLSAYLGRLADVGRG
jgi:hypothetical protein